MFDLKTLTPTTLVGGMWFKREDMFAPQGYGGINGAKLRQLMYLVDSWVAKGCKGVVSGAVANSPQHAFVSAVCKLYGINCVIVTAKKDIQSAKYLKIAAENGAHFVHSKVGYPKTLNAMARRILTKLPNHKLLEVNITLDSKLNSYKAIRNFHEVGAYQVQNIPKEVDTLIIPCGSCNSATSILYGLVKYPQPNIKKIVLLGIGNLGSSDINYIPDRLERICAESGLPMSDMFDFSFDGDPTKQIQIDYYNLNGSGYCRYEDLMPESLHGIVFHPRYEGKCIRYLREVLHGKYWGEHSLFWIVGSDIA